MATPLGVASTPAKLRMGGPVMTADVALMPNGAKSKLVTARRVKRTVRRKTTQEIEWTSTDFDTGQSHVIASVRASGVPVSGCYVNNSYVPSALERKSTAGLLRLFTASADTIVKLPAGVTSARCGMPVSGNSSFFSLVRNSKSNRFSVSVQRGAQVIVRSPLLPNGLKNVSLTVIPRGWDAQPTALVLADRGPRQVMQVLSTAGVWQTVSVPAVQPPLRIVAVAGVRLGTSTYLVLQLQDRAKAISYQSVELQPQLL